MQHASCLSLPLLCTTTTLFCRTKTSNFLVAHYFYGGIVVCAYSIFCVHVRFYFSPCWPLAFLIVSQPLWMFMFFFLQNSSLLFLITPSSSFSQITAKKTWLCCCFFLSKSLGGHVNSFQIMQGWPAIWQIFGRNTASDFSNLFYVISRAVRWVKFETIFEI